MPYSNTGEHDFIGKVTAVIEENISNEQFGVSELASRIGMSRSNLLRKIKKASNLSVSQFISQVRLKNAMDMLKEEDLTVSEVSYRVGFSSVSYFIKCFREYYGYPPGEVGKTVEVKTVEMGKGEEPGNETEPARGTEPEGGPGETGKSGRSGKKRFLLAAGAVFIVVAATLLFIGLRPGRASGSKLEKSIAVLPFKNDSNDSTNLYIINGLMESILENLQLIEDLRVISRTSVEKYRTHPETIPEIARELKANYIVEGSGQKIGDQILLNIQLIEAASDKHLLAKRYKRKVGDIFDLQQEVARSIAGEIKAIITPEEAAQIEKIPTTILEAYDYFLKGREFLRRGAREDLEAAVPLFSEAIELDPDFALAYADMAITYAGMDMYQVEKNHAEQIDYYADKAMLLDPKLSQSLIAKAMYHNTRGEYELALPYLEKALEYHPNSSLVINMLSDYYTRFVPDTEKYLEYALLGIGLDIAAHDSSDASFIYLHLSNAFMQSGFVEEAKKYIDLSIQFDPENPFTGLLRAYIQLAGGADLNQTREALEELLRKYPSRDDILKELGVICYYMKDYNSAYDYYRRMMEIAEEQGQDPYSGEKAKIGLILSKLGHEEESQKYFQEYLAWAEKDQSVYKHLSLAAYYSYMGDSDKAIEHMQLFSEQENYPYWYILFLDMDDPLFDSVNGLPEFQRILSEIKVKFWRYHNQIRDSLREKGLL